MELATVENNGEVKTTKSIRKKALVWVISIVVVGVVIVVVIVVSAVMLTQKSTDDTSGGLTSKKGRRFKRKPKMDYPSTVGIFPFTIGSHDRLIVKVENPQFSQENYFIYKYPPGTYANLDALVTGLNTVANFEAIYFNTLNTTWSINGFLIWENVNGKLGFTWTDTYYTQISFEKYPSKSPLFTVSSGQQGINDASTQPNWIALIEGFGIPVNTIFIADRPVILPFPSS